jgi:hypothetical protein
MIQLSRGARGNGTRFVVRWSLCVRVIVLTLACVTQLAGITWATGICPNEAARVGPSMNLPDCRAYELVTPADKSSAVQDMDTSSTKTIPAIDGERLALETLVTFGPRPQLGGSFSVFTRTPFHWEIESVKDKDSGSTVYENQIFSPELSQIGIYSETSYPHSSDLTFQVGPAGGPFATVAETPRADQHKHSPRGDKLFGASAGTSNVPAFSHVVFGSTDHTLLSATGTDERAYDLYEWFDGQIRLVNEKEGKVIGRCGAVLGAGELVSPFGTFGAEFAHNAVSADGSKIFFTSPDITGGEGEGCYTAGSEHRRGPNAPRLYMSVTEAAGGHQETVEVSEPEGVTLSETEREDMPVYYQAALANGSEVFFTTERVLTPEAVKDDSHLYEYDTEAPVGERLKVIFQGSNAEEQAAAGATSVFPSEDGSTVYFYRDELSVLYRYEAGAGAAQPIASMVDPAQGEVEGGGGGDEAPYTTPDGEFFMFVSTEVHGAHGELELRGAGHNEIYRYDRTDGSIMCVSCGPGSASAGNAYEGTSKGHPGFLGDFATPDESPERIIMSANGSEVFFDSTAALTPQVVDEGVSNVYEWEADDTNGCMQSLGCTYLISQGDSQSSSELIGASVDGSNVFFMTHAQLVPQDTDTSNDIYDARVDGGFPPPSEQVPCLGDTCLSVPVAPNDPTPALNSFVGPGNPVPVEVVKKCGKGKVRDKKGACVRKREARKKGKAKRAARRAVRHGRRGSR